MQKVPPSRPAPGLGALLLAPALFMAAWLVYFQLWRVILMLFTGYLGADADWSLLSGAALRGARFDLSVAAKIMLVPMAWWMMFPPGTLARGKIFNVLYFALVFICTFTLAAEVEFYKEFQVRLGPLAIEYFSTQNDHNEIVAGMIWRGYPVVRWLIVVIASTLLFWSVSRRVFFHSEVAAPPWKRGLALIITIPLAVIAHRGGLQQSPLRWGDAIFSQNTYANHMAQNGVHAMMMTLWNARDGQDETRRWIRSITHEAAVSAMRSATLLPGEELIDPGLYPLKRRAVPAQSIGLKKRPKHVVLIVMESFSGRFCGALGAPFGATPNFDKLADSGVFFTHAFSAGTHTAQGVFTTLCSWPNLPVHESVMKMPLGQQPFLSLPAILNKEGFQTMYLNNGLLSWDNKLGFFRNQGMQKFVGRSDYINPTFMDENWGVSDRDLFDRALLECDDAAGTGRPFFAVILTLTNHAPFNLPAVDGLAPISSGGEQNMRLNGMHYADWALGRFMDEARTKPWFNDTLFVLLGDHGFGIPPVLTEVNLLHMHVPLLFYGPGIFADPPERRSVVAGHLDILPTILGLLGSDAVHHSFGRNLFGLSSGDPGRTYVKPCGDSHLGWIEGDKIVVSALGRPPKIYHFDLGHPPSATDITTTAPPGMLETMLERLRATVHLGCDMIEKRAADAGVFKK